MFCHLLTVMLFLTKCLTNLWKFLIIKLGLCHPVTSSDSTQLWATGGKNAHILPFSWTVHDYTELSATSRWPVTSGLMSTLIADQNFCVDVISRYLYWCKMVMEKMVHPMGGYDCTEERILVADNRSHIHVVYEWSVTHSN